MIHYIDCMKYMAKCSDNQFDLAIVDPEWGRKQHGGINRDKMVSQKSGSKIFVQSPNHKKKNWDNKPVGKEYFKELFRVSKHQIIWGINYFESPGPGRIIWDKVNDGTDQSNCEIAYNSLNNRVDLVRYMWRGMMQGKSLKEGHIQQGNKKLNEKIIHPTQKPVLLYKWLLNKYAQPGWKIFDSHLGAGSIAIACHDLGFELEACENDFDYYSDAVKRIDWHKRQLNLWNGK